MTAKKSIDPFVIGAEMRDIISDAVMDATLMDFVTYAVEFAEGGVTAFPLTLHGVSIGPKVSLLKGADVVMTPFMESLYVDENRHQMLFDLGADMVLNYRQLPVLALLLTEGWIVEIVTNDPIAARKRGTGSSLPVSRDPRRKEKLVIVAMSLDRRTCGALIDMTRDPQGQIILGAQQIIARHTVPDDMTMESGLLSAFYDGVDRAAQHIMGRLGMQTDQGRPVSSQAPKTQASSIFTGNEAPFGFSARMPDRRM